MNHVQTTTIALFMFGFVFFIENSSYEGNDSTMRVCVCVFIEKHMKPKFARAAVQTHMDLDQIKT